MQGMLFLELRKRRSEIIKHQTAVKSPAQALHHETVFKFCYHKFIDGCKLSIFDE